MPEQGDFGCGGEFCSDCSCAKCRQARWDDFKPGFLFHIDLESDEPEDEEPEDGEA